MGEGPRVAGSAEIQKHKESVAERKQLEDFTSSLQSQHPSWTRRRCKRLAIRIIKGRRRK